MNPWQEVRPSPPPPRFRCPPPYAHFPGPGAPPRGPDHRPPFFAPPPPPQQATCPKRWPGQIMDGHSGNSQWNSWPRHPPPLLPMQVPLIRPPHYFLEMAAQLRRRGPPPSPQPPSPLTHQPPPSLSQPPPQTPPPLAQQPPPPPQHDIYTFGGCRPPLPSANRPTSSGSYELSPCGTQWDRPHHPNYRQSPMAFQGPCPNQGHCPQTFGGKMNDGSGNTKSNHPLLSSSSSSSILKCNVCGVFGDCYHSHLYKEPTRNRSKPVDSDRARGSSRSLGKRRSSDCELDSESHRRKRKCVSYESQKCSRSRERKLKDDERDLSERNVSHGRDHRNKPVSAKAHSLEKHCGTHHKHGEPDKTRESSRNRDPSKTRDLSKNRDFSRHKNISKSKVFSKNEELPKNKDISKNKDYSKNKDFSKNKDGSSHHTSRRKPSDDKSLRSVSHDRCRDHGKSPSRSRSLEGHRRPLQEDVMSDVEDEKDAEKELEEETLMWLRCSPADLYYERDQANAACVSAMPKLITLLDRFEDEVVNRGLKAKASKPQYDPPVVCKEKCKPPKHKVADTSESDSSDSESSGDDELAVLELDRKRKHPDRLHEELWFNEPGQMNDGPLCRCSLNAKCSGIRHGIYPEEVHLVPCSPHSNNADKLFHYRITMSPHTNFLTKVPTVIKHDEHEFVFEGFSMFSHYKLMKLPTCKVVRFNIEYAIHYIEEKLPENFTVRGLELFYDYLYRELLELFDLDLRGVGDSAGCKRFHFFPRFARALEDNGKEILSMNAILSYLLSCSKPLVEESELKKLAEMTQHEYQNFADEVKGMIVTYPGMKPCSLRVDQLDRDRLSPSSLVHPEIVHFGIRPVQLCYAGNPQYQKAWRDYVKYRHLLANKPKVSYQDRHKLMQKELRLQEMRTKSNLKRDVTVVVSSKGFYRTGIMCDIVQHAMLLPVLVCHLRFHKALDILEADIGHQFEDRYLLQLALTHPSYRENYGTNPDHARNSLTNCGIRHPEYGDRRIQYINTRKRGITTLINIMSRFGKHEETMSNINHNERLEFLGDAVVEFLTSIHLFHLFPEIEEGGLATYRAAIVQNQHLAILAKKLQLERFMLYAHGSDLCHNLELRHAMANCFEALMGALFLDGGVDAADRVFSQTLFSVNLLLDIWVNYPLHPIQEQFPGGDRQWVESVPLLNKLLQFEKQIGIEFTHIRLLARAFTHRSVGYNNLTLGSNQRLEFLGDTVLQLVASEYLYKFFPEHHEGHLSLLRSSLVNNKTQSVVCDDLGMVDYAIYAYPRGELKIKDRADLLEAFLGALYVDKGLEYCQVFCEVCFFPRLQDFILNQDWNDPKSKLQQCCLTLRTMEGGEPDIPIYKVIECKGPTNTRIFTVAVYFRGQRLAKGSGHSIQRAEMSAASKALESSKANLFPQLSHQRRVIERSVKQHQLDCIEPKTEVCKVANSDFVALLPKGMRKKHSAKE